MSELTNINELIITNEAIDSKEENMDELVNTNTNSTTEGIAPTHNYVKEYNEIYSSELFNSFYDKYSHKELIDIEKRQKALHKELERINQEKLMVFTKNYPYEMFKPHQTPVFCYKHSNTSYYYNLNGERINTQEEGGENVIYSLPAKRGIVTVITYYCFSLCSIVAYSYNYSISQDNQTVKFLYKGQTLLNLQTRDSVSDSADVPRGDIFTALENYDCNDFLNGYYGTHKNKIGITLSYYLNHLITLGGFESLYKTCPENAIKIILKDRSLDLHTPQSLYALLNIPKELCNELIRKDLLPEFLRIRGYISSIPNVPITDWAEIIENSRKTKEDLEFFKIKIESTWGKDITTPLELITKEYVGKLSKYYSFKKFYNYVVEETINQGYNCLRIFIRELVDYINMAETMNIKPTLYSSYLKQTHDILARNHKIYLDEHQEEIFKNRYKDSEPMKVRVGEEQYKIVIPSCSEEVKKEGDSLNHCVGSYIKKIIDGESLIYFLRKEEAISLITMEIKNGKICQARGAHNRAPNNQEKEAIYKYAEKANLMVTI